MTRPSDVYPEYPREKILAHIRGAGYEPVAFRIPVQGEVYLDCRTYFIRAHIASYPGSDNSERIICKRRVS